LPNNLDVLIRPLSNWITQAIGTRLQLINSSTDYEGCKSM